MNIMSCKQMAANGQGLPKYGN